MKNIVENESNKTISTLLTHTKIEREKKNLEKLLRLKEKSVPYKKKEWIAGKSINVKKNYMNVFLSKTRE